MTRQKILVVSALALCGLLCNRVEAQLAEINDRLAALGEDIRVAAMEFYTTEPAVGQIIYANDRDLRMGSDWVPFDPWRREPDPPDRNIAWLSDQVDSTANGLAASDTQAAVSRAMATWDGVGSASIPLVELPDYGLDWGYVQWLADMGGIPGWYADITQAGWLPGTFFDAIAPPDGADYILGVTFTFIWVDAAGEPTDMDNNGKEDVAFREIYYNNAFTWGIDTDDPIDVETVVLHETGHGLSLDHFGEIFTTKKNDKLHFAPRAVMNAAYTGVQQELTGTDNGAFSSIWASWPNN